MKKNLRVRVGWLPSEDILSCDFEKYLDYMDLKLTEHVRDTISLLYKQKQKTRWNSDISNFFSEKKSILAYISLEIDICRSAIFYTSLWRHTRTNFHDLGIKSKEEALPILWYQTTLLWACQFQVHRGCLSQQRMVRFRFVLFCFVFNQSFVLN